MLFGANVILLIASLIDKERKDSKKKIAEVDDKIDNSGKDKKKDSKEKSKLDEEDE